MSTKRPTNGLHKRNANPVEGQKKIIALLIREAAVKNQKLKHVDATPEADRILAQLADPNVDLATKKQIKDRFSKIHVDWVNAYEESERNRVSRARGRPRSHTTCSKHTFFGILYVGRERAGDQHAIISQRRLRPTPRP